MQGNGEAKPRLVLCAGQGCDERKTCQRFRSRPTSSEWASYDIEAARHEGICPHYVQITFHRSTRTRH